MNLLKILLTAAMLALLVILCVGLAVRRGRASRRAFQKHLGRAAYWGASLFRQPFSLWIAWRRHWYQPPVALANELAGGLHSGVDTLQVDSGQTVPVTNSYIGGGKYLVWMRGANSTATTPSASLATGAATKAAFPLGISTDAPYQAGDWVNVERFGAKPGTVVGISAGVVTADDWVYSAANGLVGSCAVGNPGTVWCIGKATKTVTGIGQEVSFVHCLPFLLIVTNGSPNTYALGTPL